MLVSLPNHRFQVLPEGIHDSTLQEVKYAYSTNPIRHLLFDGLKEGAMALSKAGCKYLYLNGSFVSSKRNPGDYDACWDLEGVEFEVLDPVFLDFSYGTGPQKEKYLGEFYPSTFIEAESNLMFIDFFQITYNADAKKGIVRIETQNDPMLRS